MITVCNHLASLVMPIGDPQDGFSSAGLQTVIVAIPGNTHFLLDSCN